MNENDTQPDFPAGMVADVVDKCYTFVSYSRITHEGYSQISLKKVSRMGAGAFLTEVIKAAQLLSAQGVNVDVYSVTSWLVLMPRPCPSSGSNSKAASAPSSRLPAMCVPGPCP